MIYGQEDLSTAGTWAGLLGFRTIPPILTPPQPRKKGRLKVCLQFNGHYWDCSEGNRKDPAVT